MMMHIPFHMNALVVEHNNSYALQEVPVPESFMHESILIDVKAVAANPMDWKFLECDLAPEGSIAGCDAAGVIVKLGDSEVEAKEINSKYGLKVGDFVSGFVHGMSSTHPENGAFANYCWIDAGASIKFNPKDKHGFEKTKALGDHIPGNEIIDSFEKAASLPSSLFTAAMVFLVNLNKRIDFDNDEWQDTNSKLLVYGGSTSFALHLLQINKLVKGFKNVITISSKKHDQALTNFNVSENFDYRNPEFEKDIVKKHHDIEYIIDCVSNQETFKNAYKIANDVVKDGHHKVHLINLAGLSNDVIDEAKRNDDRIINSSTSLFSMETFPMSYGPFKIIPDPIYRKTALKNIAKLNKAILNGQYKTIPVKINEKSGFEGVESAVSGIKKGKNSGEKFVVRM
ncbi:hypothetical protein QEN19_002447 [Hanseniaspora menglaensis]